MKIYTRLVLDIETGAMVEADTFDYTGPVDLFCGASSQQKNTYNMQNQLSQQMMTQSQAIFGSSSKVFGDLVGSLAPTVAAGPNQEGFSAAEKSALNSSAITNAGIAARNAKSAVGDALAAQNGGNTTTASGTTAGIDASIASSGAQNTADQLNQINVKDYETGRENYNTAVGAMENATNVFNPATSAASAASGALNDQSNTANQMAQQDNSWMQAVSGALGGVAGAVATGGMKNLGSGVGFFGGNSPAPGSH